MPEVVSGWWRHCHPEVLPGILATHQYKPSQPEKQPKPTAKELKDIEPASEEERDPAKYKNRWKSKSSWRGPVILFDSDLH